MIAGWLTKSFHITHNYNARYNVCSYILMQTRDYAARKGTRERYRAKTKKKKIKAIVEKVGYVPPSKKVNKFEMKQASPIYGIDDSWRQKPVDDVWPVKYFQRPVFSFKEIIELHREAHHPTMYNKTNACVNALIELNLKLNKKNKYVERFSRIIDVPHIFNSDQNQRKVLAFCKNLQEQEKANNSGADFVGGTELIKKIQTGSFLYKEYDYIVAHADILAELLLLRGLFKKKFPNVRTGNLGNDMNKMVRKFKNGIQYAAIPDKTFKEYGVIDVTFGLLDMDIKHLEENFHVLINDIASMKLPIQGPFIRRVRITGEISREHLKINFEEYLPKNVQEEINEEEDDTAIIASH